MLLEIGEEHAMKEVLQRSMFNQVLVSYILDALHCQSRDFSLLEVNW